MEQHGGSHGYLRKRSLRSIAAIPVWLLESPGRVHPHGGDNTVYGQAGRSSSRHNYEAAPEGMGAINSPGPAVRWVYLEAASVRFGRDASPRRWSLSPARIHVAERSSPTRLWQRSGYEMRAIASSVNRKKTSNSTTLCPYRKVEQPVVRTSGYCVESAIALGEIEFSRCPSRLTNHSTRPLAKLAPLASRAAGQFDR